MTALAFEHLKVLIVDDNVHMRTLLRRLLGALGIHDVFEAADGQSGIDSLHAGKFDLVLTDFEMKPMNGINFTRAVRTFPDSSNALVPIIMITGHTEIAHVRRARDAGITEFIAKPVTTKSLLVRLTEIVDRPRPFVRSASYIGPDRRRKLGKADCALSRRQDDFAGHLPK